MRTARIVLVMTLAVLIASPLFAAKGEKKKAKPAPCPADQQVCKMTEGLTLTAEQTAKLDALKKEFGPKLTEARKKGDVLTADQKKARSEAEKKAKADGKKGKEFNQAIEAAVNATAEQKAKMAESRKEFGELSKKLEQAAMAVLTPEQQAQVKKKLDEAKKAKKAK